MVGAEGLEPSAYGCGSLHGQVRKRLITLGILQFFSVFDAVRCFARTVDVIGFSRAEKTQSAK